ncbi:MAG: hypothetical protein ACJ785_08325, partial [Gemmatimonadaceae bacterium]
MRHSQLQTIALPASRFPLPAKHISCTSFDAQNSLKVRRQGMRVLKVSLSMLSMLALAACGPRQVEVR